MTSDPFQRIRPLEVAAGWVTGFDDARPAEHTAATRPRDALEAAVTRALIEPPCLVEFSGGRDSSAVLAVAVHVARREGLEPPVPLTRRFPRLSDTVEDGWQQQVIRRLGLGEWVRLDLDDDLDLLGPAAQSSLRRRGLLWPPTVHTKGATFAAACGGWLVTGEGGDEVFGERRLTPLRRLLTRRGVRKARLARSALRMLAPRHLRRRLLRGEVVQQTERPWLRADAQRAFTEAVLDDTVAEPLAWSASVRAVLRRRTAVVGLHNLDVVARQSGVRLLHPLLDPAFIEAVAGSAPRLGFPSRIEALRAVVGDLLPEGLLRRSTKATFNAAAFHRHSRRFVAEWDGGGVDDALVDAEALSAAWAARVPHAGSFALLQCAWLATGAKSA